MAIEAIKSLIEAGIPNATAIITGGDGKYEATVISNSFAGMSMVKQHQLVYATVKAHIASGELHALSIKAFTPAQWDEQGSK